MFNFKIIILLILVFTAHLSSAVDDNEISINVTKTNIHKLEQSITSMIPVDSKEALSNEYEMWWITNIDKDLELYIQQEKILTNKQEQLLRSYMKLVINDKIIDKNQVYEDLKNCNHEYCLLYKNYLKSSITQGTTKETNHAGEMILRYILGYKNYRSSEVDDFQDYGVNNDIFLISNDLRVLPYWLIIDCPMILDVQYKYVEHGVADILVPKDTRITKTASWENLSNIINDMRAGWYNTAGSIDDNIWGLNRYETDFAPQLIKHDMSLEEALKPSLVWSYYGLWNRQKYLKLLDQIKINIINLQNFYLNNDYLKQWSSKSENIMAFYIFLRFDQLDEDLHDQPAFKLFTKAIYQLDQIKASTKDFLQNDYNLALKIAILNDYPFEAIKWLLDAGADVNYKHLDETILMSAVNRPDIINLLIRHGAKVDVQNNFGKTALFYAIQFNNLETVKILFKAGANINHQILSSEILSKKEGFDLYTYNKPLVVSYYNPPSPDLDLRHIFGFTPLAYAKRYASAEINQYLILNGAKLIITEEKLNKWINLRAWE